MHKVYATGEFSKKGYKGGSYGNIYMKNKETIQYDLQTW